MTEKSYFWDGTVRGDAKFAPYDIAGFTDALDKMTSVESGYVIPGNANNLEVTGAGVNEYVSINSGAAIVRGRFYTSNAVTYNIKIHQNLTEYPRIDRVVLRLDYSTDTINIKVLSGVPASVPHPPECRDIEGSLFEVPLASVYMGPGEYIVATANINDERKFYNTAPHSYTYPLQNIMPNSELLGFSSLGPNPPDMWMLSNTATFIETTKFDLMARGRGVIITGAQNAGMNITLDTGTISTMHTLSTIIRVTSGTCSINFGGQTRVVYPTSDPVVITLRVATSGYQVLTVVGGSVGTNIFTIGQTTLTQGFIQAPFVPRHETIFFNDIIQTGGFFNSTYSSFTSEYNSGFLWGNTRLLPGIRGMIASLQIYDTGSSGAGPYFVSIQDPDTNADLLRVDVAGLPNSTPNSNVGIITMRYNQTTVPAGYEYTTQIQAVASGINTMNITIYLYGIVV